MTSLLDRLWAQADGADRVLLADPVVRAVPVQECGEELIDIAEVDQLRVDTRLADPAGHHRLLRVGVVERLVDAAKGLGDVRIAVVEGFRPTVLQQRYFDDHVASLTARHPEWPPDRVHREATAYVAEPTEFAPHVSGGAVDLTLVGPDDEELDMGCAVNATPAQSAGGCATGFPELPAPARAARARLADALHAVGLVNYPTEWWHWSYGDQHWALRTGAAHAKYAAIPPVRPEAPIRPTLPDDGTGALIRRQRGSTAVDLPHG
ncbi:M15 family metallopeptidase [Saccharopolyspora sp. ASAGF58]|uniref:M15 family metallopeptidase n=1 Tax=Saccharopolyspora sp. ASAGF58 TaxID=2719023 RepID=UPI00143FCB04|nr:M15 family metallopeptidase [Saccharopolyspora sp. ASAGF58]QIZ38598.1 dipeptidase [Saccharopolyspora sp. ASAGF58]